MFEKYNDYITRQKQKWPNFDDSELDKKFIPAYNDGQRIRVKFPWGEVKTGTVGATTGWRPCFILILTKRSLSSSYLLKDNVVFTNEKCTRCTQ